MEEEMEETQDNEDMKRGKESNKEKDSKKSNYEICTLRIFKEEEGWK